MKQTEEQRLVDKILVAIERECRDSLGTFFLYAWREGIANILETESKYARLVKWINGEIESAKTMVNVFAPAIRTADYRNAEIKQYLEQMQRLAVLTHSKELLLDERTTTEMRENIEYALCKLYGIHYSKELLCYV